MAEYRGPEKRRYVRIYRKIGLNIIGYDKEKCLPKFDEEVGLNISAGGILIECSKRLAVGTSLRLLLLLTYDSKYRIIRTAADIVWNKRSSAGTYYFGCQFKRLKSDYKKELIRFIKAHLP